MIYVLCVYYTAYTCMYVYRYIDPLASQLHGEFINHRTRGRSSEADKLLRARGLAEAVLVTERLMIGNTNQPINSGIEWHRNVWPNNS